MNRILNVGVNTKMNILQVAQRGEAILGLVAAHVSDNEFASPWLYALSEAMHSTMLAREGVGIAAPQVYVSKRVIIVASKPNARYPDAPEMKPIVMVNPKILQFSKETVLGEEGCLSVENQRAQVARAEEITVSYFSIKGQYVEDTFSGFAARIVQHEIDHLEGILFIDR